MASYESLIKKIYADGGRKFLFLNVPPTSRTPTFLQQGEDVMKKHAAWVDDFNGGLERMVYRFKRKHRAVSFLFFRAIGRVELMMGMCRLRLSFMTRTRL